MYFFYVRHGDPIYKPDSLTPLGQRQAEAVGRRLARYGIDRIYASTSERAVLTATPLAEIMHKEIVKLDFCNESHAWRELTYPTEDGDRRWLFHVPKAKMLFCEPELIALGDRWYEHPEFKEFDYKAGLDRIYEESYKLFSELGYEHIRGSGKYKIIRKNDERVALFAHQGFGMAFLPLMLDIPYPLFARNFDIFHSSVTAIDFVEYGDYAIPKIVSLASDAHLYKADLPANYKRF